MSDNQKLKADKFDIFKKENEILEHSDGILDKNDLTAEELKQEYRFINNKYKKLLSEMMKITSIGDKNYKKIMDANEKIRQQKLELEKLNLQLREANATKDKFYSIVAHDLRNPLQFLLLSSDLLETEPAANGSESVKKFISKVFKTARNLSELLENLLQWSLSQSGGMDSRPKTIELHMLAMESIDYYTDIANDKGINLICKVPEGTYVVADEEMIKSVFRNLIGNAIKFTGSGGTVTLKTRRKGEYVTISVMDTGVGITKEVLEKLFHFGETNPTSGTAKEKGTGMGLILCKEFVEKNGGELTVTSTVGKGSVFKFFLKTGRAEDF